VALVRTGVSEELSALKIRVTRIGELGTTLVAFLLNVLQLLVTANNVHNSPIPVGLMMEPILSSETLVISRATRRNISEDGILHCFIVVVTYGNRISPQTLKK
jgi:hypothetical protein